MPRDPLEAFATQLASDDVVVIEATGNAASLAAVIGPHVSRVVIANPKQVRPHRAREDQNRHDRRQRAGEALCQRLFARGLDRRRSDANAAPPGDAAQPDRAAALAAEEHHPVDPGIDVVVALALVAAIGDVERFGSPEKLVG